MTEGFGETDVAVSLMKEALTLLDTPAATPAARLLRMAIEAADDIGVDTPDGASPNAEENGQPGDEGSA